MIVHMKKLTILVLETQREKMLKSLRKLGVIHVRNLTKPVSEDLVVTEEHINELRHAVSVLSEYEIKNCQQKINWGKDQICRKAKEIVSVYLEKEELKKLDRIGNMYLDFAELQASRGKIMKMKDWREKLDAFLKFNEQELLTNAGKIYHEVAKELALGEYEKYKPKQDREYISDFDKEVKKMLKAKEKKK